MVIAVDVDEVLFPLKEEFSKLNLCRKSGAKLLIEDQIKYAEEVSEEIPVILLNKPWNKGFKRSNVYRAKDWPQIIKHAEEIISPSSQSLYSRI